MSDAQTQTLPRKHRELITLVQYNALLKAHQKLFDKTMDLHRKLDELTVEKETWRENFYELARQTSTSLN